MNHEKIAELIKRYKSGTATPDEIALLDNIWAEAQSRNTLNADHTDEELEIIEDEMFFAIKNEIKKQEFDSKRSFRLGPTIYKVAATVLFLVGVSLWLYSSSTRTLEIRTNFGEQVSVTLPDQSKVKLNGNSILRYTSHWDEDAPREVWIEGEGFFSVIHTENHQKFIVHGLSQLNVEVLGTKFNIKTRQAASEVMLAEGKVKLQLGGADSTRALFLKPGELATVRDRKLSAQSVDKKHYISWVENKLFFDRTPLRDLSILLKDTYGLTVTFADPALNKRELSGEIWATNADEILYAVGETLDLRVERHGQSVVISSKRN
jgi:transmembrane sensor